MSLRLPPADPRPQFDAALDQVERVMARLEPGDLGRPTPCDTFDVRTLLAHLVAVLRKLALVTRGGDMTSLADPADDLGPDLDDAQRAFRLARDDLARLWVSADLDAAYAVAWGSMTGRELLDAYAHEFTVHAWDLSRVTGREAELDPALAEAALAWFGGHVPADARSAGGPFGPVVPVAADADIHTRLAGFVGRAV